jgi:hypothetical protein
MWITFFGIVRMSVELSRGGKPLHPFSPIFYHHHFPHFTTDITPPELRTPLFPLCRGQEDQFFRYIRFPENNYLLSHHSGSFHVVELETPFNPHFSGLYGYSMRVSALRDTIFPPEE